MPLKSARRLPRKFNRPTSAATRQLAQRRRRQRSQLKWEKLKRWLRRVQRIFAGWQQFFLRWILVVIFAVLLIVFVVFIFSPAVQVREIRIFRTEPRLDIDHVQQVLSPLFRRHMLFLSEFEVFSLLQQEIPDLGTVEMKKMYPSQVLVTISLDPFVARLHITNPDEEQEVGTGAHIDFLTNEGVYIQTTAAENYESLPLIMLVDWGAKPLPGTMLFPLEYLERIDEAERILSKQFNHQIVSRTLYLRAQEFHIQLENYEIWFDVRSPLEEHLRRYRTLLDAVPPEEIEHYVDLRLMDRVVYK